MTQLSSGYDQRIEEVFSDRSQIIARKTDQIFGFIFLFQWLFGVALALLYSPYAWQGEVHYVHLHVYLAIFLGGALAAYPMYLCFRRRGDAGNRYVNATAQMFFSILLIHLTGGRIETHFHLFGSLAFLAFYRDWKVILLATVITAADHFLRGYFYPQSIYGVLSASPWRAAEHSGWVLFEAVVLLLSTQGSVKELRAHSKDHVDLEINMKVAQAEVKERQKILENLQHAQGQLVQSEKMASLGEMAGGMAHEINTPLGAITLSASQLKDLGPRSPEKDEIAKEIVQDILDSAERISRIVRGLKNFSRDGTKGGEYVFCDLVTVLHESTALCEMQLKNKGIKLEIGTCPKALDIQCNPSQMAQVFVNLINNARDAVENLPEKWIRISLEDEVDTMKLRVTDSGKGIPEEIRNKLFQPFFTTKKIGKGTGLGLSIIHGIVKHHKGAISVDAENANTSFVVSIPKFQSL